MSETAATATPSPSLKRRQSIDKNIENDNYPPKKKRESAIRSENNLRMLIQNGQVDTHKQKVSPKKVLSLAKEARTETLVALISARKFDKLDKLYIRTVTAASNGSEEDVETSDSDPETLPLLQPKNRPESETSNETKTTNTTNTLNLTNTAKVQNPTNTSNLQNPTNTTKVSNLDNISVSNSINVIKVPNPTSTTEVPNVNITLNVSISTSNIKMPNLTNISNVSTPTSTTEVPNQTNTCNVSNKISTTNVSNTETTNKEAPLLLGNNFTTNNREPMDSSITEVSSTNNLEQSKEEGTDFDLNRSLLDAEVLALHNLILTLAPDKDDNGTENHKTVDIKHIEDIYETVIKVKSKLNAIYKQKSIKLRKSFETIQLFVPELKRGLILPTLQQLKEKSLATGEEPKPLRQEQPFYIPTSQQTKSSKSPSPDT